MSNYSVAKNTYHIAINDHILDNVHGLIGITKVESAIEQLPIFKRLHNISQLGLVNRIFPCAVHTRYSHSLGVMHVASKMAESINGKFREPFFSDDEIQVIRLAGLLHDIGHYPMSHNIETAYKKEFHAKEPVRDQLDVYVNCPRMLDPSNDKALNNQITSSLKGYSGSEGFHHERIGYNIITNNKTLHKAIREHYILQLDGNGNDPKLNRFYNYKIDDNATYSDAEVDDIVNNVLTVIGSIVVGDYSFHDANELPYTDNPKDHLFFKSYSAMVQLLHSEMDADNIDYLLRDATFSGTTYGTMDMGILISALTVSEFNYNGGGLSGKRYLVGVLEKRVGCVEQFLLSKYMAYGQVIFSKYVSILEAMLFRVACKMKDGDRNYDRNKLKKLSQSLTTTTDYLEFNDSYIFNRISTFRDAIGGYNSSLSSPDQEMFRQINNNRAFDVQAEVSSVSIHQDTLLENIKGSNLYKEFCKLYNDLGEKSERDLNVSPLMKDLMSYRFENYRLTKQLPRAEFRTKYQADFSTPLLAVKAEYYRLANGIPVIETNAQYQFIQSEEKEEREELIPKLVVDLESSLLHELYPLEFVYLRKYLIENNEDVEYGEEKANDN